MVSTSLGKVSKAEPSVVNLVLSSGNMFLGVLGSDHISTIVAGSGATNCERTSNLNALTDVADGGCTSSGDSKLTCDTCKQAIVPINNCAELQAITDSEKNIYLLQNDIGKHSQ